MTDSSRWSDSFLDGMRMRGDPLADEAIAALFASGNVDGFQRVLDHIRSDSDEVPKDLPPAVHGYFEHSGNVSPREAAIDEAGEKFFAAHGPEIMMILCCYSLPWDYSDAKGVKVLWQTGYLENRPNRRVAETAQMIIDVMAPGGLSPNGKGVRSAQKVRLMHAAVRHMIRHDPANPWDEAKLGAPINQEDLAYTLMSFSWIVLDGLGKLGLDVGQPAARAYLETWRTVGGVMGIVPELIPDNLEQARQLTEITHRRQAAPSRQGQEMTAALVGLVADVLGRGLRPFSTSLIRFFVGDRVAEMLGLEHRPIADRLVGVFAWIAELLDTWVAKTRRRRLLFGKFSIDLVQHFVDNRVPDAREFRIPADLHEYWKTGTRSTDAAA